MNGLLTGLLIGLLVGATIASAVWYVYLAWSPGAAAWRERRP